MLKFFKNKILALIYPNKCVFCEKVTSKNDLICDKCAEGVRINASVKPLPISPGEKITHCISPLKYSGKARDAVRRFKFYGYKGYAEFFSELIANEINKNISDIKFDIISAVPLSRKREAKRGYNQSRWLAKALGERLNIPYKETLIKIKDNLPQHELPLEQRMQNIKDVYSPVDLKNIKGKNILLCDDIITTGNTLKECVKVLHYGGSKNIICCTIAHVQ